MADRFRKRCSVEKCVWQDEKDFTLDVPLNSQNSHIYRFENKDTIQDNRIFYHTNRLSMDLKIKNIQDNRLFYHTNRESKKVMVSACVT